MTNAQVEADILAAHADHLNSGLRGSAAFPSMTSDQRRTLTPLMQLAEWLSELLIAVEPRPAFVQRLGQELALAATRSQLSLLERYRKAIVFGLATLGSALSLLGLVLFYLFRQRDTTRSTPAT
jgi:hypothetical protein